MNARVIQSAHVNVDSLSNAQVIRINDIVHSDDTATVKQNMIRQALLK